MVKKPNLSFLKGLMFWIAIIALGLILSELWSIRGNKRTDIDISQFYNLWQDGRIESIVIIEQDIEGELTTPAQIGEYQDVVSFKTHIPYPDPDLVRQLVEDSTILVSSKTSSNFWQYILPWLPIVLIFVVWFFIWKKMMEGGGAGKAFSFAKSKAKRFIANKDKVTFKDVAGEEEAKEELREVIEFLKDPKKFTRLGAKVPKGVILIGAPGTGKTLLARAVAGEADVPFFSITGSDFVEIFVGVGASRVRDLFEKGKQSAPSIIFIDEIDAVGRHRGNTVSGAHEEREQTLNALLSEMDGFEPNQGIIVIAATNRPEVLDAALLRPGRFDRRVIVDMPDFRGRKGILEVHTRHLPLSDDVDLKKIAQGTPGFAGADLANMVNEAALQAAKLNKNKVEMSDFEWAKDKVLMGVERKSLLINKEEKNVTAYHESGHALVGKLQKESDPIHKVSIIPRGRALGVTQSLPLDDRRIYKKDYLQATLAQLLGGRAAEMLVFKIPTTGAGNDLEKATQLAKNLVCEWGMSEKIGPINHSGREQKLFFQGREISYNRDYSEKTAQIIDEEVKRIVEEAYQKAYHILSQHRQILDEMVDLLLAKESISGEDINEILLRNNIDIPKKENEPEL